MIDGITSAPNLARKSCQCVLSIRKSTVLKWFHRDTYLGSSIVLKLTARAPRIADVTANLLNVAAPREVAHAHSCPSELRHALGQMPVDTRCTAPLGDLKDVQKGLSA